MRRRLLLLLLLLLPPPPPPPFQTNFLQHDILNYKPAL
jgi:hypothetical protein